MRIHALTWFVVGKTGDSLNVKRGTAEQLSLWSKLYGCLKKRTRSLFCYLEIMTYHVKIKKMSYELCVVQSCFYNNRNHTQIIFIHWVWFQTKILYVVLRVVSHHRPSQRLGLAGPLHPDLVLSQCATVPGDLQPRTDSCPPVHVHGCLLGLTCWDTSLHSASVLFHRSPFSSPSSPTSGP